MQMRERRCASKLPSLSIGGESEAPGRPIRGERRRDFELADDRIEVIRSDQHAGGGA
jgi:hypothetical protein